MIMIRKQQHLFAFFVGGLSIAFAAAGVGQATAAKAQTDTVGTTLTPAGDAEGGGSAVLEVNTKGEFICYEIQTTDVTTPITGATITVGAEGETVFDLVVIDRGADLVECVSVSRHSTPTRRDLNRLLRDPGSYYLHLFNDEHPAGSGAVQGQLASAG
jgi:hypothetical protein